MAKALLDTRTIQPSANWKLHPFSSAFMGLTPNEQVAEGLDLMISMALGEIQDPNHERHGYMVLPNVDLLPTNEEDAKDATHFP
jgi:hypothetical protein